MHLKPNKIYATTKTLQNWIKSVIHPQMHSLAPVLASQSKTAARSKPRDINKRTPQKQKRKDYLEEIYLKSNLEFIATYLSSCIIACYHLDSHFSKNLSWCPPKATRLLNEKLKTCNFWPDSTFPAIVLPRWGMMKGNRSFWCHYTLWLYSLLLLFLRKIVFLKFKWAFTCLWEKYKNKFQDVILVGKKGLNDRLFLQATTAMCICKSIYTSICGLAF